MIEPFGNTVATLTGSRIEVLESTGAVGAARGAGVGAGIYTSLEEAFQDVSLVDQYHPEKNDTPYREAYLRWRALLDTKL